MLRTLSEAVLYFSKQELPFRRRDESSGSLNRGNYRELLESFSKFDAVFSVVCMVRLLNQKGVMLEFSLVFLVIHRMI